MTIAQFGEVPIWQTYCRICTSTQREGMGRCMLLRGTMRHIMWADTLWDILVRPVSASQFCFNQVSCTLSWSTWLKNAEIQKVQTTLRFNESRMWTKTLHSSSVPTNNPTPETSNRHLVMSQSTGEDFGDGSKPWYLVNPKIAGIYGCSSHQKCIYRYWPIPILVDISAVALDKVC